MNRKYIAIYVTVLLLTMFSCVESKQKEAEVETEEQAETPIFEKGNLTSKEKFVGDVYMNLLVPEDSIYTTKSGSVTFEAGSRTNWHYHPSGQILMITEGTGYHQIEGQVKEIIAKGDVVKVPKNVKHWRGGSKEEAMTHIFVIPNTEMGASVWFEPVSDEEFSE